MDSIKNIGMDCVGCGACVNVCPHGALAMRHDSEGFLQPVIDTVRCAGCGICRKACPVSGIAFSLKTMPPKCFVAYSNDDDAMRSSSGGLFTVLAEHVLEQGGAVCGAAFDDGWLVRHIVVSTGDDLEKLRTSKYLQSDMNSVHREIRALLDSGKTVLFSGTPCQVAGLHGFLGRDYGNLLSVDVFCHGVPSPKVWERYLAECSCGTVLSVNFRDKAENRGGGGVSHQFPLGGVTSV